MDNQPLVSVLMTAYNREKYIAEAIESVINQTYFNWELIIVDDCSQDKTVEIAKKYEAKDKRIKVYVNEQNLGDYPNRNKAASFAKGEFLKYLDADDLLYPHSIHAMVHAMLCHPTAAYGFCVNSANDTLRYPILFNSRQAFKKHFFQGGFFYAGPGGAIIRKNYFFRVGGFSNDRHVSDTKLWMTLSENYDSIQFWPCLIWWRLHENQESVIEKENCELIKLRYEMFINQLISTKRLDIDEKRYCINNLKRIYVRKILSYLSNANFKVAKQLLATSHRPLFFYFFLSLIPYNRIGRFIRHVFYKNND